MALVIGLNSGSSFDGIDVVAVEIEMADDGYPKRPVFVGGNTYPWPDKVAEMVLRSFENKLSIFELTRLNYVAGAVYAEAARSLMRELNISSDKVVAIGYDGQTIYQEPPDHSRMAAFASDEDLVARWLDGPYPCGLQIGEPAIVAAACDAITVTHFRPMDHALGGTGAPLMQYLDFVAFRDIGPILTLNLGGISNCQLADSDRSKMMAFDCGPGNVMLDHTARRLLHQPYDKDGQAAARGKIHQPLLDRLLQHDFFHRPVPRSAWRLDFGSSYADQCLDDFKSLSAEDFLATFTEFTAIAISHSITEHIGRLNEISTIMASGGGVRNKQLMLRLAERLPKSLRLTTSDEFGIPFQYKEAIKFAALAHAHVHHLANNIPAASGAERFGVLGKATVPPRLAQSALK